MRRQQRGSCVECSVLSERLSCCEGRRPNRYKEPNRREVLAGTTKGCLKSAGARPLTQTATFTQISRQQEGEVALLGRATVFAYLVRTVDRASSVKMPLISICTNVSMPPDAKRELARSVTSLFANEAHVSCAPHFTACKRAPAVIAA